MPLQKQFRGLSDLLGRYEGGNLSLELLPAVVLALDVLPFVEPTRYKETTGALITANQSVGFVVPDNESWLVEMLQWRNQAVSVATDQTAVRFAHHAAGFTSMNLQENDTTFLAAAIPGAMPSAGMRFDSHLICQPGDFVGIMSLRADGATKPTYHVRVGYHKMNV